MDDFVCRVCCNTDNNKPHTAKEMMFGLKDQFAYVECGRCGCLQIKSIPDNLAEYYPDNYYSLEARSFQHKPFKVFLKKQLINYRIFGKKNLLGFLFAKKYSPEDFYEWFKRTDVAFDDKILDVGSGSGELLIRLRKSGFENVTGVDPVIANDIHYAGDIIVHKKLLSEMQGQYKLLIFNHSFEHMPDMHDTMRESCRLLKPGGFMIVRVPVTGTYAWRKYGVNWVQLDAPRHLHVPTVAGIQFLCDTYNLRLKDVLFDSHDFQFWGSEQYLKDIPLRSEKSYSATYRQENSIFAKEQFVEFKKLAAALNAKQDGDQATFIIGKTS